MTSEKVIQALNKQVNAELYASYLYLSMAAYFEGTSFDGFASWMKLQSEEEYAHAMKFYTFLNDIGAKVELDSIQKPKTSWETPIEVFEDAHKHEILVTEMIHDLAELSENEKDFATRNFLNYFIDEQVEEVATVSQIVEKFKLIGDNKSGLFWLDRELSRRVVTPE